MLHRILGSPANSQFGLAGQLLRAIRRVECPSPHPSWGQHPIPSSLRFRCSLHYFSSTALFGHDDRIDGGRLTSQRRYQFKSSRQMNITNCLCKTWLEVRVAAAVARVSFLWKIDTHGKILLLVGLKASDYGDVYSSKEQVANYSAGKSGDVLLLCGA